MKTTMIVSVLCLSIFSLSSSLQTGVLFGQEIAPEAEVGGVFLFRGG